MKIRFMALVAGLLAVLPMSSAWAGGATTTYYYGALKAAVSSTGGGKVYAATSKSMPSSDAYVTTNVQSDQNKSESQSMTFYAFAQVNDGYEFGGWATSDGGTAVSTDNPYAVSVTASSTTDGSPTVQTVYALFSKKQLAAFGITFEPGVGGTYTVDGAAPENKTGLTEATTVKLASDDPNFLNWKVNGAIVNGNPYDLTCTAATTVGAEFLTADQVAEATTFDALTAALANDGKKKVTIPTGVTIVIAKGATLTVPAGKQLVVDGSLAVAGTLSNSGAIFGNGKIYKISKKITQGEIITPVNGAGGKYTSWKYRNTTVETISPSLTGVDGVSSIVWGVLYNGDKVAQMSQQSPKAIMVSIGTDSINTISTIADNADKNEVATSDRFVLFADCNLTGPILEKSSSDKRLNFTGWIDCAGKKITHSVGRTNSSFHSRILNGTVSFTPGTDYQNATATFVNCGSITVKNIKGTACPMHFYDCGTEAKPTSLTFGYNSSPGTRKNYFYSGYYTYSFSTSKDDGNTEVRGGSFTTDPTSWLQNVTDANGEDASLKAVGPQNGLYKVVVKPKTKDLAEVNGKVYQSLQAAVDEIAANTPTTLKLKENVILEDSLVILAGKILTIELDGHDISGGSIVNSGALRVEDNSNQAEKGIFSTPVANNGNGTIDLTYGQYAGKFTLNGGTLTTHGGTFTDTFSYEEKGGVAKLRGGTYDCAIVVPAGYEMVDNVLGETCKGVIICDNPLSSADVSYTVRGLDPVDRGLGISDFDLYSNYKHSKSGWMTRSDFAGREAQWDRLAELKCTVEPVESKAFEATMSFDRPVKAGSVSGVASLVGRTETMALEDDIAAGEDYHVFIPMVTGAGYYAISYKNMFNGEENDRWAKLLCGVKNNGSLENIGTTMTFKYQLRTQTRAPGYSAQNPVYNETFTTYASATYKFTGKGAIAGDNDYTTLAAAVDAVAVGGTVRLSKDNGENVTVGKACTIDANNFAFTGEITAADGYSVVKGDNGIYTVIKNVEIEIQTSASGDDAVAQPTFNVEVTAAQLAELGVDTKADDVQEQAAEKLNERDESGLKNWEKIVVEQEKAKAAVPVLAKVVETVEVKNDGKQTVLTTGEKVGDDAAAVDLAKQPAGTYRKAYVSEDAQGNKVTIADPEAPTISIVRNESTDKTIVLPVPGLKSNKQQVTVADVIDVSSLTSGDMVTYCNENGVKQSWTFKGVDANGKQSWEGDGSQGIAGSSDDPADGCPLPAGGAFWLTRVQPTKPVVIVAEAPKEIPAPEVRNNEWNLEANPDPTNEVALDDVVQGAAEGDEVIVQTTNGAQKRVTLNDKGEWTYKKSVKDENGRIKKIDAKATIGGGQGFWYISNRKEGEGKTSIKWK